MMVVTGEIDSNDGGNVNSGVDIDYSCWIHFYIYSCCGIFLLLYSFKF